MLSLNEISVIEAANQLGAKSLDVALEGLVVRWDSGLKDDETFIRTLFLKWYSICEPNWYNGLPDPEESILKKIIDDKGDIDTFSGEIKFVIGVLAYIFPWCFGEMDMWEKRSIELLMAAEKESPNSTVFTN